MADQPVTNPGAPQGQAKKKGMGPLAWIAIGCGGIIIIGFLIFTVGGIWVAHKAKGVAEEFQKNPAMASARLVVKMNPDLELVKENDKDQTLTIRDKQTGKVGTFNLKDIKEGKFSFTNDKGETTTVNGNGGGGGLTVTGNGGKTKFSMGSAQGMKEVPGWVPVYSNGKSTSLFNSASEGKVSGAFSVETSDAVDTVADYYENSLKKAGFKVSRQTISTDSGQTVMLSGQSSDSSKSVTATITRDGDTTKAEISYSTNS